MRVLGIDPGLSAMGWGLLEKQGSRLRVLDSGTIKTTPSTPFVQRLRQLRDEIAEVIAQWQPDAVAMEKPIYCQNMKTALLLGQAGGMAMLAAAEAGLEVTEFTPLEVKKAITGSGRAGKDQVLRMVRALLALDKAPSDDHVSDALGCAICYAHREKSIRLRASARL
jgi:crossover junction endodeoxyribonuclease RuvC